jgi:hypothetical protein
MTTLVQGLALLKLIMMQIKKLDLLLQTANLTPSQPLMEKMLT